MRLLSGRDTSFWQLSWLTGDYSHAAVRLWSFRLGRVTRGGKGEGSFRSEVYTCLRRSSAFRFRRVAHCHRRPSFE